ncbi:MAG: DNA mismatch repair protein MutS [Flavobacteriales bacterium]|nr:DNA mismatch repair protein MutS [Flavobacteriia bacterium]NCP06689.1 DNA mismatch repair protein MutS [Flavobacteriales bacterium]NCP84185.1 DNA mismatch repair protein MutS [Bacteroidota bacterium]PIY10652.1 MAG: DNA mismatch repair protein MutS [Flavobacteriaceae bacterium CG_4_10_14_3_um_filter_33_47]PJB18718.1 MAG: DNA mismatch repair protein MutS [Flavobacteriaceae bacterium CG_4_9_14_3_um_filter_33_16]
MINPLPYYTEHLKIYKAEALRLKKQMTFLSTIRVLVFLMTVFGIYMVFPIWKLSLFIGILGIAIFIFLLLKYADKKVESNLNKELIKINEDEIDILSGNFHHRNQGLPFQDPNHFYSLDIDLFGRGSFFQYINRTTISEGTEQLANMLKANHISDITLRQDAIKELSYKPEWRQGYSATSSLVEVETPAKVIIKWLLGHRPFLTKQIKWLAIGFSIISIVLLGFSIFNIIDKSLIGYWLLLGLGITGIYLKRINYLALNSDKLKDTFRHYASLLNQIETETFTSELLLQKQNQIKSKEKKASQIFKEFSKTLDALDNRNNLISAIFGNGLFLLDLKNSYHIEQWMSLHATKVEEWFEVVSFFDAFNTLGNVAFNHPDFVFPDIKTHGAVINATQLGHPLLNKTKRVDSDVLIDNEQFFIVTGANMAGKSTFLRTVSLHIVMANVGLPVCAKASQYHPVKLITSMRTSDSLTDESSYFFSELKRLKYIVDAIKKEPYFIVLDEILKGTNSTDKAIGSKKFVEKLVASKATGIIATHDLSLCTIEKELSEVKNYYFDAEIINDELHFDYTLKEGICKNMNASFLLKKMDII